MSDCTYHHICGLPDDADPEVQLCILHSHNPDKDTQAFADPPPCRSGCPPQQYVELPESLAARARRDRVHHKGFRGKTLTLVTTLVDTQRSSVKD